MPGLHLDASVAQSLALAASALETDGYELSDDAPPALEEVAAVWAPLMTTDARHAWPELEPLASTSAKQFMEALFALVPPLGLGAYTELFTTRQRLTRSWSEYQHDTPLVLAPISTRGPFPAGSDLDGPAAAQDIISSLRATLAVNVLGLPSVAVPVGLIDGLPQAVQILGPRFGEELCLKAAAVVERAAQTPTPIDPLEAPSLPTRASGRG